MIVRPRNAIIALAVLIVVAASFLMLLMNTSVPAFSTKELMEDPKAESYLGRRIQLVGNVVQSNESGFFLNDPENKSDSAYLIYVQAQNVERPAGFEIGKTILVEGKLTSMGDIWIF